MPHRGVDMTFLLIAVVLGLIPAMIAANKGRSFIGWYVYGFLLFIIALPHSLLIGRAGDRKCPHCAESIRKEANVCRYCGRDVTASDVPTGTLGAPAAQSSAGNRLLLVAVCVAVFVGAVVAFAYDQKQAVAGTNTERVAP